MAAWIGLTFVQVLSPPHNVSDHDPVCAGAPWTMGEDGEVMGGILLIFLRDVPPGMPFLMSSAWGLTLGAEKRGRVLGNPNIG
jgi:hypothetical protein